MNRHVTIVGAGMFGTALANIVAENDHDIQLLSRSEEQAANLRESRVNERSLPGFRIHDNVRPTADESSALSEADVVVMAVPSHAFRETARRAGQWVRDDAVVVSTTKGIESTGFNLMSAVLRDELPGRGIGVLSGPNLAVEIARKQITATVIASDSAPLNGLIQEIFHTAYFRVYSSFDTYGVELAGALKNIYAIASGFATAMGVGQNTHGMLLTRSLAEMSRFGASMGANPLTFLGLAGVGDLFVTCSSPLSRNFQIGQLMGGGLSLDAAIEKLGRLAEGINTVRTIKQRADETGVYMPIASGLYAILFDDAPVEQVIMEVMMSEQGSDVEFVTRL